MKLYHIFIKYKYILIIILLIIPGIYPLLKLGLPPTHDGEYHIIRFHQFYKTLSSGVIYPRWAGDLNNGFGVPLFNYVYPLPNYVASLLHFFGFSFIDSFKLNMLFATLIGCIFFYFWSKLYWGNFGGVVSAVFYGYAPYRFVDIYIRGSVGELWAMAFLPGLLWTVSKIYKHKSINLVITGGIFYGLIIFSHNILAVMFTIFVITYCIFLIISRRSDKKLAALYVLVFFIGISLSAIFWLPALAEKNFVRGLEIYNPTESFVELYEILIPSWGSGFSNDGIQNRMSFQVGLLPLVVVFVILCFLVTRFNKLNEHRVILFNFLWFIFIIYLMMKISAPLWENINLLSYFQFPWRFLSINIICSSFLAGAVISIFKNKKKAFIGLILIIFMIISTIKYSKPAYYHMRSDDYYLTRSNFINGTNSPGDLFNTKWFGRSDEMKTNLVYINSKGQFNQIVNNINYKKFYINSLSDGIIKAKLSYFPGWVVLENGKNKNVSISKNGLIEFPVYKGQHIIEIIFTDTIIRKIAFYWTLGTVLVLALVLFKINTFKKL